MKNIEGVLIGPLIIQHKALVICCAALPMATVMWPPKIVQYTLVWICSYLFHAYYYLSLSPH